MSETGSRYCFNARRRYFWRDLRKPWFWKMWGVKRTLAFIWKDTIGGCDG